MNLMYEVWAMENSRHSFKIEAQLKNKSVLAIEIVTKHEIKISMSEMMGARLIRVFICRFNTKQQRETVIV